MKTITLIRHAKVDIANDTSLYAHELQSYVQAYDVAPIDNTNIPPKQTSVLAKSADIVVCSNLKRTEESAKVLGVEIAEKNKLFNEATVPNMKLPYIKFKPHTWLVILRGLMLLRLGGKDNMLKTSKAQAQKAAKRLELLSNENNAVVLIGHGGMNWFIHKVLLAKSWELDGKISHKNWGTIRLFKKEKL